MRCLNDWLAHRQKGFLLLIILMAGSTYGFAQDTAAVSIEEAKVAQGAADVWLELIDSVEDYAKSWQQAAPLVQQQLSEEAWEQTLESTLGPLGPLVSRALQDRQYTTALPNAPEGEYVIVTYESSYTQLEAAVETVIMTKTEDGTWRMAGYFVRPAS